MNNQSTWSQIQWRTIPMFSSCHKNISSLSTSPYSINIKHNFLKSLTYLQFLLISIWKLQPLLITRVHSIYISPYILDHFIIQLHDMEQCPYYHYLSSSQNYQWGSFPSSSFQGIEIWITNYGASRMRLFHFFLDPILLKMFSTENISLLIEHFFIYRWL